MSTLFRWVSRGLRGHCRGDRHRNLIGAWLLPRFGDGLDVTEAAFVDHLRRSSAGPRALFAEYFAPEPDPAPDPT